MAGDNDSSGKAQPLLGKSAASNPLEPEECLFELNGKKVQAWNEEHFRRLRKFHKVENSFFSEVVDDGLGSTTSAFNLNKPRAEGMHGKGGHGQYLSDCGKFVCKSMSDGDNESLLRRTKSYVERVLTGQSLLVPIYMHFRDPTTRRRYVIMANLAPPLHDSWDFKYDLKGCADDKILEKGGKPVTPVRRRWYRADRWSKCCWTDLRWKYKEGKESARKLEFAFPPDQRTDIMQKIQGDTQWLIKEGLMDYSIFMAVRQTSLDKHQPADTRDSPVREYARLEGQDRVVVVSLGIIDFLQSWTAGKQVAQCIKILETNKATIPPKPYGERFQRHFDKRFKADDSVLMV